jgi:hypothetical protein
MSAHVFECDHCLRRKKLEPENDKSLSSRVEDQKQIRNVQPPDSDTNSVFQVEVPPWNEAYEISSTDIEGKTNMA